MEHGRKDKDLIWELVESRTDRVYNLFSVAIHKNASPRTGAIHEFQVLDSPDWVAIIPITSDDKMVLVKQYRHGSREISLEPPGGLVKNGQSPEQSGLEELEEEPAIDPARWNSWGGSTPCLPCFQTSFGFTSREM